MNGREPIDLFGAGEGAGAASGRGAPEGLRYRADLLDAAEESTLVDQVRQLPFRAFEFHGFTGKRRVVSFGFRYDYEQETSLPAEPIPPFLLALRDVAPETYRAPLAPLVDGRPPAAELPAAAPPRTVREEDQP